jgi:nucleoside-diphosphate-sugar epimerase
MTGTLRRHDVPVPVSLVHRAEVMLAALLRIPSKQSTDSTWERSADEGSRRRRHSAAVVADVPNTDALMTAARGLRVDAVVHELTAIRKLPARYRTWTRPLRTEGTANLLTLARAAGATLMVTQSFLGGYGYSNHRADNRSRTYRLTEEDGFGLPGRTPGLERIIAALREAERLTLTSPGIAGVVLRYGVFYGHGATLRTMLSLLKKRQLPVPRDAGGARSYAYLPDAAAASVAALERGRPGHAYNICDDEPTDWAAFIDAATRTFGLPRAHVFRVGCSR